MFNLNYNLMKTKLLKRAMLVGFMLMMVFASALANNVDEEKNNSRQLMSTDITIIPLEMSEGEETSVTIPIDEGYQYNPDGTIATEYDGGRIEWDDGLRSFVIRITAISKGRVVLRLVLIAIDGFSTKTIDIVININK